LIKLHESPFYATGGGQVADTGVLECEGGGCRALVTDVIRLGTDQIVALEPEHGAFEPGERVFAHVDRAVRHATECNHTATHLLHAALRRHLGDHVRQAGSYVGPDKLRFDFTHGGGLSADELRAIEDDVNAWILESHPVRALQTTLDEAKALGAMALFNEKYGEIVRMVEIGDGSFSRELCGGTHVRSTSEIGLFRLLNETSSAANVRRIEAITGPEAVKYMRDHDRRLHDAAGVLRVPPERVADSVRELREQLRELERAAKAGTNGSAAVDVDQLAARAGQTAGATILTAAVAVADGEALLKLADRLKAKLGDAAIVLGRAGDGRVDLIASVAPSLVGRGVKAGEIIKIAAAEVGGGGGGRDTMARAGGRDPERLDDAIVAAQRAIESALSS
jgi:alanyl-tRNA synthetase